MTWFPGPRAEPAGCGPSQVLTVAVGVEYVCIIMYIIYYMFLLQEIFSPTKLIWNVLPAKVNDSTIIRSSMTLGGAGISQQNGKCYEPQVGP